MGNNNWSGPHGQIPSNIKNGCPIFRWIFLLFFVYSLSFSPTLIQFDEYYYWDRHSIQQNNERKSSGDLWIITIKSHFDVDICYNVFSQNIRRIIQAKRIEF